MRKLLILIVVLGMASAAYAGFSISVHEVGGAEYDGHPLASSEELWLDVDATGATSGEYAYWALVVEAAEGTISGGVVGAIPPAGTQNTVDDNTVFDRIFFYFYPYCPLTSTQGGVSGTISDAGGAVLTGLQIDQILFHCEDLMDATVELWMSPNYGQGTFRLEDTLVISQIPEPMTMALLGFGALLLRRRK